MDVDIDLADPEKAIHMFKNVVLASRIEKDEIKKHPAGVYFQNIPKDPISGLSAIPYKEAEDLGYLKVDMLHLTLLEHFDSKEEIREYTKKEPNWKLLMDRSIVEQLFQIHNHYDLINKIKPECIEELADCIALIRPGKRYYVDSYIHNKEEVRKILYIKDEKGYTFKRSHSIAYAQTVALQMHIIEKGKENVIKRIND